MNWGFGALSEPAMNAGQRFALGVEITTGIWSSYGQAAEAIRVGLIKSGYATDVRVAHLSGYIHPFFSIEGKARYSHASASDLRETLLTVIEAMGYVMDAGATKWQAETVNYSGPVGNTTSTTTADGQSVYLGSAYNQQPTTSPISLGVVDDLASALGVTPTQAAIIGALGVLVVLVAVKKVL